MKHFNHYTDIEDGQPTVVAIGNFDGVHRGHQMLLESVIDSAQAQDRTPAVLTFEPHPVKVLAPHVSVQRITSASERLALLEMYGVQLTLAQTFDRRFARLNPREFVEKVLVGGLRAKKVVVGYDFGFGADRAGTTETLMNLGQEYGFATEIVGAQVDQEGDVISSSRIRTLIAAGHMTESMELLGRPFHVLGTVVRGDQRGRQIGFPTANVAWDQQIIIGTGVYSGWLDFGDGPLPSVINMGHQPTFGDERELALEVHALTTPVPQLYGRAVRVAFSKKIRDERKFGGIEELTAQVKQDAEVASRSLEMQPTPSTLTWRFVSAS